MADFIVKLDTAGFAKAARTMPRLLERGIRFAFLEHGAEFERLADSTFTARLSGPFKKNTTSDKLANRTGFLRRSIRYSVGRAGESGGGSPADLVLNASIGNATTAHYVFTQEYGATIYPRTSKYLAIPMPANLTAAGRVRFQKPRETPGMRLVKTSTGKLLIGRTENGEFVAYWILKRSVTIPARLGFQKKWRSAEMQTDRISKINSAISRTLRAAKLI